MLQDHFIVFPAVKIPDIVAAKHNGKTMLRIPFLKVSECINGIARPGQLKFNIAGYNFRIIRCCHFNHIIPVILIGKLVVGLEWVLRGNDHPDLFKIRKIEYMIGNDQMSLVYRIERTKKKRDIHNRSLSLPGMASY